MKFFSKKILLLVFSCLQILPREHTLERIRNLIVNNFLLVNGSVRITGNLNIEGNITTSGGGGNFIIGPSSSTNNGVAVFDGTSGKVLKSSSLMWPTADGAAGQFLATDGAGQILFSTPAGAGDVSAAANFTTNNALIRVDLVSGAKSIKQSSVVLDDSGNLTGITNVNGTNATFTGRVTTGAGSLASPALQVGSASVGLFSPSSGLSFVTNGASRLQISSGGTVSIAGLAGTAGVVHNDASGNLSSSLIVNADIAASANIADSKLATITTAGKVANSATTAASANTSNAIVARDSSGNFSAGTITANLTGAVTGAASLNVLKTGDTMTGNLDLASQHALLLQDTTSGNRVGLNAPTTVAASYTLSFPGATPIAGQILQTNASTPTQLEWVTSGSSAGPSSTRDIYVAKNGNDTTGNGSFNLPYLTIAKAISVANTLSSASNPVTINIAPGVYVENNAAGPLEITAAAVSLVGDSANGVIVQPSTLSNNLIATAVTAKFIELTFDANGVSSATGIALSGASNASSFSNVLFLNFATGASCTGTDASYIFDNCIFRTNSTGLSVNNAMVLCNDCIAQGSLTSTPAGTGIAATGASATVIYTGGRNFYCATGFSVTNNATLLGKAIALKVNTNAFVLTTGAQMQLEACNLRPTNTATTVININASGAGTNAKIAGCIFDGEALAPSTNSTAIKVSDQAQVNITGGQINNYTNAFVLGVSGDTAATFLEAAGVLVADCTHDIIQTGSSTLNVTSGVMSSSKITINDPTNVKMAFFDPENNNTLKIGALTDTNISLLRASIATTNSPQINYLSSLYSTQAMGLLNPLGTHPTSWYTIATGNDAHTSTITTDRTKVAGLDLVSDTASPTGGTTALRGWQLYKEGSTGNLDFNYQNTDVTGQVAVPLYTQLQLDGVNNNVNLPSSATKIVFDVDTNLYRSAANTLKTDDNFVAAGTANVNTTLTLATGSITDSTGAISFSNENLSTTGTLGAGATTITGSSDTTQLKVIGNGTQTQPIFDMQTSAAATLLSLNNAGLLTLNGTMTSSGLMTMNVPVSSITANKNLTTKEYVDSIASGLHPIGSVTAVENVSNQTLSGAPVTIDGVSVAAGQEVLLNAQSTGSQNGPWVVNAGAWTRPADFSSGSTIVAGTSVFVTSGLTYASTTWVLTQGAGGTVDVTSVKFTLFAQAGTTTASNVGGATGNVFKQKTGNDLEFKTLGSTDTHLTITDNVSTITFATNATSSNTASTIVARDASGNFTAGTITATTLAGTLSTAAQPNVTSLGTLTGLTMGGTLNLNSNAITNGSTISATTFNGALNGTASGNLPLAGGTLTGALQLPAGTAGTPSLQFAATNVGISSPSSNLVLSTNGTSRLTVSSGGTVAIPSFVTAGVVHNDASGNLSSSLIVKADVDAAAGIVDTKLATISTAGKVLNSATTATSANTASAIVARDASGNFSAGTITASLTGAASLNVLKAGDTMTGNLNFATQNGVRLQDTTSGNYVGLNAPSTVAASYTLSFPGTAPAAGQFLQTNASTPTQFEWVTSASTSGPTATQAIYVAKNGNDTTGNGSFAFPYLTVSKAVTVANTLASASNPIAINVGPGIYIEDNSAGPLAITVDGVAIVGNSVNDTIIQPNTLSNDLFSVTVTVFQMSTLTIDAGAGGSTASGVSFNSNAAGVARFQSVAAYRFNVGFNLLSAAGVPIVLLDNVQPRGNTTGVAIDSIRAIIKNATFLGPFSGSTISNTGITITGATSLVTTLSTSFRLMSTAMSAAGGSNTRVLGSIIENTTNGIGVTGSAVAEIVGCEFIVNNASSINIAVSGAGSSANINGCLFNGRDASNVVQGIAVKSTAQGTMSINSSTIDGVVTAILCGTAGDTSSTILRSNAVGIKNCTNDIVQVGSSALTFNAGSAASTSITIADSTNVALTFFDTASNDSLAIGNLSDTNTTLLEAQISGGHPVPSINYKSSLYSAQSIIYENETGNAATGGALSQGTTTLASITTNRANVAGVRLVSDTASPVGGTTALRGWDINKNGSAAELAFKYQNSDTNGQAAIAQYTLMQLDGVNNQVQLPNTSIGNPTIVFGSDTNLYRSAANTLKTDDNFVVGGSTLTVAAGSAATPSIQFTGSTNTGFSAATANTISIDTNGVERMSVSTTAITTVLPLVLTNLLANQALQTADPATGTTVTTTSTTSILLLTLTADKTNVTITFPPSPINGQFFTIALGTPIANRITFTAFNGGTGGATVVGPLTALDANANYSATANGASVTYIYYSTNNAWYRVARG